MSSPRSRWECRQAPGAAGSCREPSGASQESGQEPAGAFRNRQGAARSCQELTKKAAGSYRDCREPPGAGSCRES